MKNAKLLSLVSLLLLTACGGQSTEPVGKLDTDTPQVEQPEQPDTTPDEAETPDEADAPNETVIWTLDTVPAPVMTGARDSSRFPEEDAVAYIARYGVENDVGVSALEAYLSTLKDAGFVFEVSRNNVTEKSYEYSAFAANSNATVSIEFEWYEFDPDTYNAADGDLMETAVFDVYVYVEEVDVKTDLTGVNAEDLLPALPDVKWTVDEFENDSTRWKHYYTSHLNMDMITEYVDSLKESGYTVDVEEAPEGNEDHDVYDFSAFDQDGVEVRIAVTAPADGVLATTISVGIKK